MSRVLDPRVQRGMESQLALRRARLEAGERSVGWKIGFGSPAAMASLGTAAPLVGFLTESALLEPGSTCSVGGWTRPVFEPEVAAHIGRDVPGGAGRAEVETAIAGLGPALELADVDPPPEDVEAILAGNIFQRKVMLGEARPGFELAGATGRVLVDGSEAALTDDPQALTGELVALVGHVADVLGALGERLRAGEVVITGSVVPPAPAEPGSRIRFELEPLGAIELAFAP